MLSFHNKITVNIASKIASFLEPNDFFALSQTSKVFYDTVDNYLEETWQYFSTNENVIKYKNCFYIIKKLLENPQLLNIDNIVRTNFKQLINQTKIIKLFFDTGYRLILETQRDFYKFGYLTSTNLEIFQLIANGTSLNDINKIVCLQSYKDINIIYLLLDNGTELNFENLKETRTIDEIKTMIAKAHTVNSHTFYQLSYKLQELYSEEFVFDLIRKGARQKLVTWDLLSDLLLFTYDVDNIIHLFDLNFSLVNSIIRKHPINIEIIKYLISRGAVIDNNDHRLFIAACEFGNIEIVDLLIEHGSFNTSGLYTALLHDHYDLATYFINRGSDPTDALLRIAAVNFKEQIKFLIKHGANTDNIHWSIEIKTLVRYYKNSL